MSTIKHNKTRQDLLEEYEEALFRLAVHDYAEDWGQELLVEQKSLEGKDGYALDPGAYKKFKQKVLSKRFLRKFSKRTPKAVKNAAVFAGVIAVLYAFSFVTVEAVRVETLRFVAKIQDEFTSIDLGQNNAILGEGLYITWKDAYLPAYIPEGYSITSTSKAGNIKMVTYEDENGAMLMFQEFLFDEDEDVGGVNIDTENASKIESVQVSGNDGMLVVKDDRCTVSWMDYSRMFIIATQISEEETMRIAESVGPVK